VVGGLLLGRRVDTFLAMLLFQCNSSLNTTMVKAEHVTFCPFLGILKVVMDTGTLLYSVNIGNSFNQAT
jgi:hypothetical protein